MYNTLLVRLLLLFFCISLGKAITPAETLAALKLKDSASVEEGTNPHPQSNDILLPMPCQMSMPLKLVAVPAKGFLWDMNTRFGHDNAHEDSRGFYDSRHATALSAPFSAADLPKSWQKHAVKGDYYYYLMGKYEVSGLQWDAVMQEQCPAVDAENVRPKTDITWYDATAFTQKYTQWLLTTHPESLPRYRGDNRNTGFIRLPTEAEWEYAARGGQTTTSQEILEEDFFPLKDGETMTDYAVYRPEDAARIEEHSARIGSRKPNALGLYDTAGNAAEMVLDMFRFSLGGRLHGSAGGFVRKGGSYLSGTQEIYPGRREEVAFFQIDGPVKARDMGLRIALSGINTPGGIRPDTLQKEWALAGEAQDTELDASLNPLTELDRLLAATNDETERKNYQHLRNIIKENNIAFERQQMLTALSEVRTMAFLMESILNFSSRTAILKASITSYERMKKSAKKDKLASIEKSITQAQNGIDNFTNSIKQSLQFYKTKLEDIVAMPTASIDAALKQVHKELSQGNTNFDKRLLKNVQLFYKHLQSLRSKNYKAVTIEQLQEDIL